MRWVPVAGRAFGLAGLSVLAWQIVSRGLDFFQSSAPLRFIHGVDLIIHEAGHIVFLPLGPFVEVLGGSLLQVLMPALFAGYFLVQRQAASFAVALFWTGESITDVAIYMADARALRLPLLGGGHHDWNHLLGALGLLGQAELCGTFTYALGLLAILAALGVLAADVLSAWNRATSPPWGTSGSER